ncbi:uncharacterized protein LOC120444867 [Drosophila santomea]|uniref:uncharacterized protein LOC120444867 n=1 Tax=Drosophila santomea TaxID=129105 RepID=UPI0019542DD1|nr:uncharacterized protein LOC120444867 [Drosophila santomea]
MDAAYVKFVLCQCLINRVDWGLAIGCMNIVYSFFLFQFWSVELFRCLRHYPIKWVLLYGFNIMFNVIVMMRIVKRESISVFYWMCETGALLIFRIHFIYYNKDDFWLGKREFYHVSNIVIDVYIGLSLLAMIYVICGLRLKLEAQFPDEEMAKDCIFDPEMAKKAVQKHKDELLARQREEEQQGQLESDREMEELNRKAALKLAQLEEEEGSQSSLEITPTAPDEENVYSSIFLPQDFPGPSAPPESALSIESDFWYEIHDTAASDDQ